MATQTGSIDLRGANSAKLYVDDEAGEIRSEVSETYATKTEVRRTDTGSGTVVSSDDAANLPPLSLTIHGKSVQDGTPSPSAPVAIESIEGLSNLLRGTSDATGNIATTRASVVDGNIRLTPTGSAAYAKWVVDYLDYQQYSTATLTASFEVRLADVETSYTRANGMRLYYGFNPADRDDAVYNSTYDRYGYTAFSTAPTSEWERRSVTFTIPTAFTTGVESALAAGSHLSLEVYLSGSNKPMEFRHLQLEVGETLTPWGGAGIVLSDGTATPIDLDGNSLRSLPDGTEDTLEVDGEGNVTLTQRVGMAVIDGTNIKSVSVIAATGDGEGVRHQIGLLADADTSVSKRPVFYSEAFYPDGNILTASKFKVGMGLLYPYSSTVNFMAVLPSDCTTAALGNSWFAANPVEVLYPLATPQTISLGKIDLPSLPSPSFSMHVDALVTPTMDAEWWTQGGEEVGSVYQRTSALEQDVDGLTLELSEKVDSSEEWVSWLHAGTDATTHEPYLAMGKDSDYPSVVYDSDAARFYDGEGDAAENVVASFGTEGVVVGKDGSANTTISDSEIVFHDADGNEAGKISMSSEGAVPASASHTITANTSQQSYTLEGLAPLPDFTLGSLVVELFYNGTLLHKYTYTSISEAEFSVSIDLYTDATFEATQSEDTWSAALTAQHRVVGETADITFSLKWFYSGTAPMYEFGTTENTGAYSFSAGTGLVAAGQSQAVFGTYNKASQTDLFIIGNGTSDEGRSNALKVDSQGTLETSGYFQNGGTVGLGTVAQQGWLTALGMDVETIQNDSTWTILRYGHVVMVQCHGYQGAANANTAKIAGVLADYKPAYNVSSTISTSAGTSTQVARLCVYASDGGVYIAPAGYTSSATWYGTLTYIY